MNQFRQLLYQIQGILRSMGIHPLLFAVGALLCIFFPRFFLLALVGYGIYWIAQNFWTRPKSTGKRGRRSRRR